MITSRVWIEGETQRLPVAPGSRPVRHVGGQHSRKSVVDRLQELSNVSALTQDCILQEALPDQRSLLIAAALVDQRMYLASSIDCRARQTRHCRHKRERYLPLLAPITRSNSPVKDQNINIQHLRQPNTSDFTNEVLTIWEEKFVQHQLLRSDILYLLVHDDILGIIESAVILSESRMSTALFFDLEMILQQLDRQNVSNPDSPQPKGTLHRRLLNVIWTRELSAKARFESAPLQTGTSHSEAFPPTPRLRLLSPVQRVEYPRNHTGTLTANGSFTQAISKKTNKQKTLQHLVDPGSKFMSLKGDLQLSRQTLWTHSNNVAISGRWIQDNCTDELLRHRSPVILKMRKQVAARYLFSILMLRTSKAVTSRFQTWMIHTGALRYEAFVQRFCRLKSALKIMTMARRVLKRSFYTRWERWTSITAHQREMERLAAIATVQSWIRRLLGKRRAMTYVVTHSATMIQAAWRGYHCRRTLRRRKRYTAYCASAHVVQRAFRAYHNRRQFALHLALHRASLCITRSLRRYCARRRLFQSWCERVARFHSAAVIQLWMRQTLRRIRNARHLHALQRAAVLTLQRFFFFARFRVRFGTRVQRLIQRRHRAAVRLQNAYRAKMARARFYILKDELEAQRRQEILHAMWSNAYATTLQRWWRKCRRYLGALSAGVLTTTHSE